MLEPVTQYLAESTVHSFVHLTGDRRLYVKLIWVIAFLISASYCSVKVAESCKKYISAEVTSAVKANSLKFEFPDIYICSENPISGSYSVTLNQSQTQLLRSYRAQVNQSLGRYNEIDDYAIRLANSLPYRFLSDTLGHQWLIQDLLTVFDLWNGTASVFNHQSRLNCLKLNWSLDSQVELRSVSDTFNLILFLDPQLPPKLDTSVDDYQMALSGRRINIKPYDWDLSYGTDFTRPAGIRVTFVPKGVLPSDLDAQIVVGPGFQHRLVLKMEGIKYDESDFTGQCVSGDSRNVVDFVNPYTREKESFRYSRGACWYREIARISLETFNCSLWPTPLPWEYRNLRSCFNVTADNSSQYRYTPIILNSTYELRSRALSSAKEICERLKPCKSRSYSFQYSLSAWPSERVFRNFLNTIFDDFDKSLKEAPGLQYLIKNGTKSDAVESLLQIVISSEGLLSSETQLSIAYSFNSLVADIGGFFGLFLGASFLSGLELVELFHNLILAACQIHSKATLVISATSSLGTIKQLEGVLSTESSAVTEMI